MERLFFKQVVFRQPWGIDLPILISSVMFCSALAGKGRFVNCEKEYELKNQKFAMFTTGHPRKLAKSNFSGHVRKEYSPIQSLTSKPTTLTLNGQDTEAESVFGVLVFNFSNAKELIRSLTDYLTIRAGIA